MLTEVCNKSIVLVNNVIKGYSGLKISSWKFKDTEFLFPLNYVPFRHLHQTFKLWPVHS